MNAQLNTIYRLICRLRMGGVTVALAACATLAISSQCFAVAADNAISLSSSAPPQTGSVPGTPAQVANAMPKQASTPTLSKPLWSELTASQQEALAPLAAEWDRMERPRKKKWLALSKKYQSMKPDEKARLHARMRAWTKLTPEQRRVARESYARAKKLNPDQRSAEWQHYQQLPEAQKKKLAEEAAAKKRITTLPSGMQNKNKISPPPKSALKHNGANAALPTSSKSAVEPAALPVAK